MEAVLGRLGGWAVFTGVMASLLMSATALLLYLHGGAREYMDSAMEDSLKIVENRHMEYLERDVNGTELLELVYQNKDKPMSLIMFPAKYQGQRSVFWGYPLEHYATGRVISAFNFDETTGTFRGNLLPRAEGIQPIIDLSSFNQPSSDFFINSKSQYRLNVITCPDNFFLGFLAQEYGYWLENERMMVYY